MAIETSFRLLFTQRQTTRFFFLKAQRWMLVILMSGWDHGGRLDHLPQKEDDAQDTEPDTFWDARSRALFRYRLVQGAQWEEDPRPLLHRTKRKEEDKRWCRWRETRPTKARPGRKAGEKAQVRNLELWIRWQVETVKAPKICGPKRATRSCGGKMWQELSMEQDYTSKKGKRRGKRAKKKETKNREEDLLTQAEELKCQNKAQGDQNWLGRQPPRVEKYYGRSQSFLRSEKGPKRKKSGRFSDSTWSWEPAVGEIESIAEKAWQLTQSSNNNGQHVEQ